MDVKKVLYITYDGLTDPLGQSQILPYLKGLSRYGYQFTILSFEKKQRLRKEKSVIEQLTKASGIDWFPLPFTSRPPLLSKLYDAIQMKRKAVALHRLRNFDMVHCRSYIAADVGLYLKRKFGVKFFFDMRGFWADEKKDGSWNVNNPLFRKVYQYYKRKEAAYLRDADHIVSLTEAGKREMFTWSSFRENTPVSVIACCADMEHFSLTDREQQVQSRKKWKIPLGKLVISYLGSIGTWYMLNEMLLFFKQLKKTYQDAEFLIVTHSDQEAIRSKILEHGLSMNDFILMQASRSEVPSVIKASDINISFIKPVYSKISSSPTKLGEVLSMGIPVICNSGVGDVKEIVLKADVGCIIDGFTENDFDPAIKSIPTLLQKSPSSIRHAISHIYDLEHGIELYRAAYKQVFT